MVVGWGTRQRLEGHGVVQLERVGRHRSSPDKGVESAHVHPSVGVMRVQSRVHTGMEMGIWRR